MVVVAQLVEHWFVEPVVTGSIPVDHPHIMYFEGCDLCLRNAIITDIHEIA